MTDPFPLVMPEPRFDAASLTRSLAFAYIVFPSEASIMKPTTEMGEIIETGRMHDRARATWFRRKRASKTARRNNP